MSKNRKQKDQIIDDQVAKLNKDLSSQLLSKSLKDNIAHMKNLFIDDDVFIMREIDNNNDSTLHFAIAFCNGLVNTAIVSEFIIKPLNLAELINKEGIINDLTKNIIQIDDIKKTSNIKEIIVDVTYGEVILFIDGINEVLVLNTKLLEKRAIDEPSSEKVLTGPREGFTESLLTNLSLVRRKLRTNQLKFKYVEIGDKTNTKGCICYIDDVVNKDVLNEFKKRLKKISIDGVLDTQYITELTRENKWSPFRTTGYTERPDVVVAKLLEGRIAFILDGTPVVLTIPYLFIENFQSNEDYYFSYYYTSFARILRIMGFLLAISVPAFYIAIAAFHKEMLPTSLFISLAIERNSTPLPIAAELFIMLTVFDLLKETGARMPTNIGEALSIVGVIVIGQAAVTARLVAAPTIIIVAFTGITSLLVPKLNAPVIFIRLFLLFLSSSLGLYGFIIGMSILMIHILNLESFKVPQIELLGQFKFQSYKDIFFRSPLWKMKNRPKRLSQNVMRLSQSGEKKNG